MMEAPARRVLVVGLGNPDCGDDGVGPGVIEKLAGLLPADVAVASPRDDLLTLVTEWEDFDAVVCIDAASLQTTLGRIHQFHLGSDDLPRDTFVMSSHAIGLVDAIGLSRALSEFLPEMIVFAVEGAAFAVGALMTPEVAAAIPEVAARVIAEIAKRRQSSDKPTKQNVKRNNIRPH